MKRTLALIAFFLPTQPQAAATLPPEAEAYLQVLPEKALTPDAVIGLAIKTSDSYQGVRAQLQATGASALRGRAALANRLSAQFDFIDDQLRPSTPFQPFRTQARKFSLGVSTLFRTGTNVSLELSHGLTELSFQTINIAPFAETRGQVIISQSLWKDAFGVATRSALNAAEQSSRSSLAAYQEERENWYFQIAQLYYQAWLAQAKERASRRYLALQERLLKTIQIKIRRGTSEEPDRLQVQGSKTNAVIALEQDKQSLGDLWRTLITTLKLPEQLMQIDPAEIPMKLDSPVERALQNCGSPTKLKTAPEQAATVQKVEASYEAAKLQVEKASSDLNPALDLNLGFAANNIEGNSSQTVDDFVRLQYPKYSASLIFKMPLGFHAERAQLAEARANEARAAALLSAAKDSLKMDWTNGCLDLHRIYQNREWLARTLKDQQRREKLEEERFQLGRAGTLQVIQAGADATQAEQLLNSTETQLRVASWKVLRLTGGVQEHLNQLEAKQ
jgi:outer membrane protein TolC